MKRIDEPLNVSAPLAWTLAPKLCYKDGPTGSSCAWNHGLWQYLRLLGLGGSPEINAGFYRHALTKVAGNARPPRILISGAADYSMLAHVLAAFRDRGVLPLVTVVDICDTPLELNRWYAAHIGCEILAQRSDICEFTAPGAFDAICTHSFFGQIAPERRPRLLSAWYELLRPGGLAISVDRIRPGSTLAAVGFTPAQAEAFCATVVREAESRQDLLGIEARELGRAAGIYAATQALYPVRSREDMRALFEQAGFHIDELDCAPNEISNPQTDRGPAIPAKAEYARVIARRK